MDVSKKRAAPLVRAVRLIAEQYSKPDAAAVTAAVFLSGLWSPGEHIHPFATALLCAATRTGLPVFTGALLSCAFAGGNALPVLIINLICGIMKLAAQVKLKSPAAINAAGAAVAVAAGFGQAFSGWLSSDGTIRALTRCGVFGSLIPLFSFIFIGLFTERPPLGAVHSRAAQLAACFASACTLSWINIGSFSAAAAWSLALTLFCALRAAKTDPSRSMSAGCVTGFVCALGCGDLALLPALGLCGLCGGFLFVGSRTFALTVSLAVSVLASLVNSGGSILTGSLLHCAAAVPVFALLCKLPVRTASIFAPCTLPVSGPRERADSRLGTLCALESSFLSLSRAFANVSTAESALGDTVPECCRSCAGCFAHGIDEFDAANAISRLTRGQDRRLPAEMMNKCPRSQRLLLELPSMGGKKLAQTAEDYLSFSRLMGSIRAAEDDSRAEDAELSRAVFAELRRMGIFCRRASVRGKRTLTLEAYDVEISSMRCTSDELRSKIGSVLGVCLSEPEFVTVGECVSLRMHSVERLRADYSCVTRAKKGENANGDTVAAFSSEDGRFYALVGDGMGSGADASVCSRLSCIFLEKLLMLGADKRDVFPLLNRVLLKKENECFAGIDLLELDLVRSRASVLKAGAAPTFVLRDGKVSVLSAKTSPLGIIDAPVMEKLDFSPRRGDWVLMVSDGVTPDQQSVRAMCTLLRSRRFNSASELALAASELKKCEKEGDDASVIAVRIA